MERTRSLFSSATFLLSSKSQREKRREDKTGEAGVFEPGWAHPGDDGWFFSDFFLFHYLFRGLGANQLWLTSENPASLIGKYGQYQHGIESDRRVVLNEEILRDAVKYNNFRILKREELLQDFLHIFRSECKLARELNQSVLLLVFSHGQPDHGIVLGNPEGKPVQRLMPSHVEIIVRETKAQVTLMTTSCFSGGWVYRPQLNSTILTAAAPKRESFSIPETIGGRSHGSLWASAVLDALMTQEAKNAQQATAAHPERTKPVKLESTSYASLAQNIYATLSTQAYNIPEGHQIRFAAQEDNWASQWNTRTGIPLGAYAAKWQALPKVSKNARSVQNSMLCKTGGRVTAQKFLEVRTECQAWLDAIPGPLNAASNVSASSRVKRFLRGEEMTAAEIMMLHKWMLYRLDLMSLATSYKTMVGLEYRDCNGFDCQAWGEQACLQRRELMNRYLDRVLDARIFPRPTSLQGRADQKPEHYLACAFVDAGWTKLQVQAALKHMSARSRQLVDGITQTLRGNNKIRQEVERTYRTIGDMTKTSPRKRRSIPEFYE